MIKEEKRNLILNVLREVSEDIGLSLDDPDFEGDFSIAAYAISSEVENSLSVFVDIELPDYIYSVTNESLLKSLVSKALIDAYTNADFINEYIVLLEYGVDEKDAKKSLVDSLDAKIRLRNKVYC